MSDVSLDVVARIISANGYEDTGVEYPGAVVIRSLGTEEPLAWWFGTANGPWEGDLMNERTGEYLAHLNTHLFGGETNPQVIADAIMKAIESVNEGDHVS